MNTAITPEMAEGFEHEFKAAWADTVPQVEGRVALVSLDRINQEDSRVLPVGVFDASEDSLYHQNATHHPASLGIVRAGAWTVANGVPYQDMRNRVIAEYLGADLRMPNTIGQGVPLKDASPGSPDLTLEERASIVEGRFRPVGRTMGRAALLASVDQMGAYDEVVVMGDSQGPSLLPGIVESLIDRAQAPSKVIMVNGAALAPNAHLGRDMILHGARGKGGKEHRMPWMKQKDTNLLRALTRQWSAHVSDYPAGMRQGTVVDELVDVVRDRLPNQSDWPEIHLVHAEKDGVSKRGSNIAAQARLSDAGFTVYRTEILDERHQVMEHQLFMGQLLRKIVRPERV